MQEARLQGRNNQHWIPDNAVTLSLPANESELVSTLHVVRSCRRDVSSRTSVILVSEFSRKPGLGGRTCDILRPILNKPRFWDWGIITNSVLFH